jgi:hypothetical protein
MIGTLAEALAASVNMNTGAWKAALIAPGPVLFESTIDLRYNGGEYPRGMIFFWLFKVICLTCFFNILV